MPYVKNILFFPSFFFLFGRTLHHPYLFIYSRTILMEVIIGSSKDDEFLNEKDTRFFSLELYD